eukprot:2836626-Karenia_brevis.AAC.1
MSRQYPRMSRDRDRFGDRGPDFGYEQLKRSGERKERSRSPRRAPRDIRVPRTPSPVRLRSRSRT